MAANPLKGQVALPAVEVEGFEQGGSLLLDFNALCALEDELGEKIEEIGGAALKSPNMMRTVMRVALEDAHGPVDDRIVGRIIQALTVEKTAALVLLAFTRSFPEAAKPANPPAAPPPNRRARRAAGTGGGASKRGSS